MENDSVRDAVERDATSHAQIFLARDFAGVPRQPHQDFLRHHLDRARHVHVPLLHRRFRPARRAAKETMKLFIRHRRAAQKIEVVQVQPERAVGLHVKECIADDVGELRFTVRRETHEFVFARVDAEAAVVRERGIDQTERMREAQLLEHLDFTSATGPDGRGGPLAHAVNRQDRRLVERRWIKRTGRVRLVMFGKKNFTVSTQPRQLGTDGFAQIQFLAKPVGQDRGKRPPAAGRDGQIRFQQPRELQNGLVVKHHRVQLRSGQRGVLKAELNGQLREVGIVFLAREPFLLCGAEDFTVAHQGRRGIVIVGRDAENVARRGHGLNKNGKRKAESGNKKFHAHRSEKGIQRPSNAGAGGEDQHRSEQQQHHDQRDQPPFFLLAGELQKFFQQRPHEMLFNLEIWTSPGKGKFAHQLLAGARPAKPASSLNPADSKPPRPGAYFTAGCALLQRT